MNKLQLEFQKMILSLSGAETKILQKLPVEDKRPYFQIGQLNLLISFFVGVMCYFAAKVWIDNDLGIIIFIFFVTISLLFQRVITRSLIKNLNYENKLSFALLCVAISIISSFAVLSILSKKNQLKNVDKLKMVYENLLSKYNNFDNNSLETQLLSDTTYKDFYTPIRTHYQQYTNFLDYAQRQLGILPRDTIQISNEIDRLKDSLNAYRDSLLSKHDKIYYNFKDSYIDSIDYPNKFRKPVDFQLIENKRILVHELKKGSTLLPRFKSITDNFYPNKFSDLALSDKVNLLLKNIDTSKIVLVFPLILVAVAIFFSLIYSKFHASSSDFYHDLLKDSERLKNEDLSKQRLKIANEIKIRSELANTSDILKSKKYENNIDKEKIHQTLDKLEGDPLLALMWLSELEFERGNNEEALEKINKAIEADNQNAYLDTRYELHPEFYQLKSKILNNLNKGNEAKDSLDRFVELDSEKKYQVNLSKEILLDRLEVENIPFYGSFKWQFKSGINILLGKNGYGKSHLVGLLIALLYDDKSKIREWIPPSAHPLAKAKLYIVSDHPVNEGEIKKLMNERDALLSQEQKLNEQLAQIAFKTTEDQSMIEDTNNVGEVVDTNENYLSLKEALATVESKIQNNFEKIDAESRRIAATKDGITGQIGRVPILAIPDSRFIDRSETTININKSASEDLKKDGATEFLYSKSFAEIIKKGLHIIAQTNSKDFSKEPYSLIERVISNLADSNWSNFQKNETETNRKPFFKFTRIETISTTGDFRFFVKSEESEEEFPLQKVSQGTFSILAICLVIYRFLVELKPQSKYPLKEKAIVFIDEIDAHLHPSWEQKVMGILRNEFPNIQFIITAHSPLIVAGSFEGEVSVLRYGNRGFTLEQIRENFIGCSTAELFKKVFEIEDKDDQYIIYSAMAEQEEALKNQMLEFQNESSRRELNSDEIKKMDELARTLNNINTAKRVRSKNATSSILEAENKTLKRQLDHLKQQFSSTSEPLKK